MDREARRRRRRFLVAFAMMWIVFAAGCNSYNGHQIWGNAAWSGSGSGQGAVDPINGQHNGDDSDGTALNDGGNGTGPEQGDGGAGGAGSDKGGGDDSDGTAPNDGGNGTGPKQGDGGADGTGSEQGGGDADGKGPNDGGAEDGNGNQGGKPGGAVKPEVPAVPPKGNEGHPSDPDSSVQLDKVTAPVIEYIAAADAKLVALTFDDGPDKKYTLEVLDILQKNGVKATFFTVGIQVKKYPEVMKRIAQEGHAIGNHSTHHPDLSKLDSKAIKEEIKETDTLIEQAAGYVPRLVRAPYGALSPLVKNIVKANNRELVGWTVDTRDWAGESVADMRENVNKNTKPGGIILMHSFGSKHVKNTVELLPLIIEDLSKQGYTFVTVDELLSAKKSDAGTGKSSKFANDK